VTLHGFKIPKNQKIVHNIQIILYTTYVVFGRNLPKIWGRVVIRKVFGRNGVL
jgi:hypothetical protein